MERLLSTDLTVVIRLGAIRLPPIRRCGAKPVLEVVVLVFVCVRGAPADYLPSYAVELVLSIGV